MKIKNYSLLAICFFAGALFITGCQTNTQTVPVSVNFGNPPAGGGPCGGKGICSAVANPTPVANNPSGVAATLQVSSTDKNVLVLTFSMADLKAKQPEQERLFTDASNTYNFDGSFDLSDKMYAPLKLAPGARIDKNSKSKVEINGDVVKVSYTYSHN
jgi:hypothetical protein